MALKSLSAGPWHELRGAMKISDEALTALLIAVIAVSFLGLVSMPFFMQWLVP